MKIWCCALHGLVVGWQSAWWLAAHLKCCIRHFLDLRLGWMDLRLSDDGLIGCRLCEYNGWVLKLWWGCGACGHCLSLLTPEFFAKQLTFFFFFWHSFTFFWSSHTSIFQRNFFTVLWSSCTRSPTHWYRQSSITWSGGLQKIGSDTTLLHAYVTYLRNK